MFEGDSADMCAGKFTLVSMGGRAEGLWYFGRRLELKASVNLASIALQVILFLLKTFHGISM